MADTMGELAGYLLSVAGRCVEEFDGGMTASIEDVGVRYDGAPDQSGDPETLGRARATDTEAAAYIELLLNTYRVGGELV